MSLSVGFDINKENLINKINKYIDVHKDRHTSIYFFNHEIYDIKVNPISIKEKDFDYRGRTALWDTLNYVLNHAKWDIFPIFVIFTDGCDTASTLYTKDEIIERIVYKRMLGWTFVFPYRDFDCYYIKDGYFPSYCMGGSIS